MNDVKIAFRKPIYPIIPELADYLDKYSRTTKTSVLYDDLLRFTGYTSIEDTDGNDTLWLRVFYSDTEFTEIEANLNKIYTLLHSDGDIATLPYLKVDTIDYCTFGNSKPFRVRVRNILNDNYTNFYIKKADASRIYGLELEELLSLYPMNYLVYNDTLIEEHILGIPGDVFIKKHLPHCSDQEKAQLSKEFVKFNERCMIGLLGDMRSYNYVIIPTHDFDQVVYRIRAIDFDQQCYEGRLKIYLPQYFKENYSMVKMVLERLLPASIEQYRKEVRSVIVRRVLANKERFDDLLNVMKQDYIAPELHVDELKRALQRLTHEKSFRYCTTMGCILETSIAFVIRNYRNVL